MYVCSPRLLCLHAVLVFPMFLYVEQKSNYVKRLISIHGKNWVQLQPTGKNHNYTGVSYKTAGSLMKLDIGKTDFSRLNWNMTQKIENGVFHISVDTIGCRVDTDQLPIATDMACKGQTNALARQWTRKFNKQGFLTVHEYYQEKRNICFLNNGHYTGFNTSKIHCHAPDSRTKSIFHGMPVDTGHTKARMDETEWDKYLLVDGDYKKCGKEIKKHIVAMNIDLERNLMWSLYLNREALTQRENWPAWSKKKVWTTWHTRDYMIQEKWKGYKFAKDDGSVELAEKLIKLVGWNKLRL